MRYQAPDIENNICKRCNLERDTIEHCLYDCEHIQPFLNLLSNWIQQELAVFNFEMTMKSFLFGDIENHEINMGLEHILLEAKKFIFYEIKENNRNSELQFASFKNRIKNLISLERKIAANKNESNKFEQKWIICAPVFDDIINPDP